MEDESLPEWSVGAVKLAQIPDPLCAASGVGQQLSGLWGRHGRRPSPAGDWTSPSLCAYGDRCLLRPLSAVSQQHFGFLGGMFGCYCLVLFGGVS